MATTKLSCPQCHRELPANYAKGGVCPACRKTFVTPEIKSAPRRQPTVAKTAVVAKAKAYLPPIVERESSSGKRVLIALLLLLLLGGGAGAYYWMNRTPHDASPGSASNTVADASKPGKNDTTPI